MYAGVDHRMYDGSFSEFSKRPLNDIEASLSKQEWIGGEQPTSADHDAFEALSATPNEETHAKAFCWYQKCVKTDPAER